MKKNFIPKSKKEKRAALILFVFMLSVTSFIGMWIMNRPTGIDYFKYATVSYEGPNDNAIASIELDTTEGVEALDLIRNIEVSFDKKEAIQNGDVITLELHPTQAQQELIRSKGYRLVTMKEKITVEGLTEPVSVDFFERVELQADEERVGLVHASVSDRIQHEDPAIEAALQNIQLKDTEFTNVLPNDSVLVELKIATETEATLRALNVSLDTRSKVLTPEKVLSVPQSIEAFGNIDTYKLKATQSITEIYAESWRSYKNFKIVNTCYSPAATHKVSLGNETPRYENGSVFFVFEFERSGWFGNKTLYNLSGYTGLLMQGDTVLQDRIQGLSVTNETDSKEVLLDALSQNGFVCSN